VFLAERSYAVPALNIEFERNELRAIRTKAARQLRTPENLARFLVLKEMGFIIDEQPASEAAQTQPVGNAEEMALA
jgi:hypothetical protein